MRVSLILLISAGLLAFAGNARAQLNTPVASARLQPLEAAVRAGEFQDAVALGRSLLDADLPERERLRIFDFLGASSYELGQYDDAVRYLEAALERAQVEDAERASILNDLGESLRAAGRPTEGRERLEAARELAMRVATDSELHAKIVNNVAGLYRDRGDFVRTEELLREALQITEKLPEQGGDRLATAHLNLAEVLRFQSRYAESAPYYEAALEVARESFPADHPYLVYFLNQYAALLSAVAEFRAAEELRFEALEVVRSLGEDYPVLEAMLLADSAADLLTQDRAEEAVRRLQRCLSLRRRIYTPGHVEIGVTLGQLARAELRRGLAQPEQLAARATASLEILAETPAAPESRADAHAVRALARLRAGDSDAARHDLNAALEIIEELRVQHGGGDLSRGRLLARYASYYDEAIHLALRQQRWADAIDFIERFRARALTERLLLDENALVDSLDPAVRERLRSDLQAATAALVGAQDALAAIAYDPSLSEDDRRHELDAQKTQLEEALRSMSAAQEQLRAQSPAWRQLVQERPTADLARIEASLQADEGMWIYWVGPSHAWLLEIASTRDLLRATPLSLPAADAALLGVEPGSLTSERLEKAMRFWEREYATSSSLESTRGIEGVVNLPQEATESNSQAGSAERLHALWKLLAPAESWKRVRDAEELTILPAGPLHLLPFEALVTTSSEEEPPRYWLDDGPPLRYADSATTLQQIAAATEKRHEYSAVDVLSVNNPLLDGGGVWPDLPALPGTEAESQHLRDALGGERIQLLSGASATESNVRAQCSDKRYLHLATHGMVDDGSSELLATLVLGREGPEAAADGRLQLFEIQQLPLRAELAVLSACRTAAGRRLESEGVFALSRGFHIAGAARVVASLWSVSDASTALLVGELFGKIAMAEKQGQPISYARALRDAKRAVRARSEWSEPFYWAPFVLSGVR